MRCPEPKSQDFGRLSSKLTNLLRDRLRNSACGQEKGVKYRFGELAKRFESAARANSGFKPVLLYHFCYLLSIAIRFASTNATSLGFTCADQKFQREPEHSATAERAFERAWAIELIGQSLERLAEKWVAADRSAEFEIIKPCLLGAEDLPRQELRIVLAYRRRHSR